MNQINPLSLVFITFKYNETVCSLNLGRFVSMVSSGCTFTLSLDNGQDVEIECESPEDALKLQKDIQKSISYALVTLALNNAISGCGSASQSGATKNPEQYFGN